MWGHSPGDKYTLDFQVVLSLEGISFVKYDHFYIGSYNTSLIKNLIEKIKNKMLLLSLYLYSALLLLMSCANIIFIEVWIILFEGWFMIIAGGGDGTLVW